MIYAHAVDARGGAGRRDHPLDEAGLEAFSARKLAARLGVQVGALYWHYPSKRALLDAVADHIVGEAHAVGVAEGGWPEGGRGDDPRLARRDARACRRCAPRRRDGEPGAGAWAYITRLRGVLTRAGMDPATGERAADVLTSYLNGHTIEEQAHSTHQRVEADRKFGFGLDLVLAGLRTIPTD